MVSIPSSTRFVFFNPGTSTLKDGMPSCSHLSQEILSQNAGAAVDSAPVEFSHAPWERWRLPWKHEELDSLDRENKIDSWG